jgi:predicted ATPase
MTRARALVLAGRFAEGAELFERYISSPFCLPVCHPYNLSAYAHALSQVGRHKEALAQLDCAIAQIERPGWHERSHYSEVLRVRGEVLRRMDLEGEAEAAFVTSIEFSRQQQAKSWELRATGSLAQLWRSQGKRKQGHDLLAPVYNWFTEGFDTKDVKEAKVLLEELRH